MNVKKGGVSGVVSGGWADRGAAGKANARWASLWYTVTRVAYLDVGESDEYTGASGDIS